MKPKQISFEKTDMRKLEEGSNLKIFFDKENGAKNFGMGWVSFEPGSKTTPHTREVEEVIYVTKGEGLVVTNSEEFILRAGDSILIPPGVEHFHENRGSVVLEQIYIFSPQGPENALRDLPLVKV